MFRGESYPGAQYGVLYNNPHEIAGHHIVYAINPQQQLVVRSIPLQHYIDGSASVFDASDFKGELGPWLPTLGLSVSNDQALLQRMRYVDSHGHWSCPIRQMLMWSGQLPAFVPIIPNPLRAGRMYGGIMTPYVSVMNAHPTTKAVPIDDQKRLHNQYWTTNGLCVYKGGEGTIIPSNEACSLYSLARATFSETWNNYTTIFSDTCTDQVISL